MDPALEERVRQIVEEQEARDLVTFQEHMRTVDRCCRCRACDNVRFSAYLRVLKQRNESSVPQSEGAT